MTRNELRKVLIVGAGGTNIGNHIARSLAKDPYFTVSVLSRGKSSASYPPDTLLIPIPSEATHADYVAAFQGQDAVISALGAEGNPKQKIMIDAAVEAGVKRFFPSEAGVDNTNLAARELSPIFDMKGGVIDYLRSKEKDGLEWTAVPTGMWLDWALDPSIGFIGINIANHTASYWANGSHKFTFTTLPTAADGVRLILKHPAETANKVFPIRNFELSQAQIVAELEKVQGVQYSITHVDHEKLIPEAKAKWASEKDIMAALELVRAGFMLPGYGSNLSEREAGVGNEVIGMDADAIKFEDVVREAVKRYTGE